MKVVKVISKSGKDRMEVITDEGSTKHIQKNGKLWMYFHGVKIKDSGDIVPIYNSIELKKGGSNEDRN